MDLDKKYYIIDGKTGDIIGTTNEEGWYPTADKHTIGGSKYITEILLPEERETRTRIYKNEVKHWFETLDRGQTDTWVLCWVDSLDYQARTTRKMVVGYRRYLINCGYPNGNMFYTSDGGGYHFATPCEVTA